ncbi:DUF1349 domain-containing protein [Nocardioides sp. J2M5]|uniref:DUF1349 domain-containing protein n=1 Tax=Nocardioides palaemonis TaxID=2829810 RepID=UPI001BA55EED|nr:DUF1349 domain-containing protein [Nocardioides palaemonis]MBS2938367.1 DUF1349 domain-containing protein [Nocardioides palaemonis]
MDATDWTAGSRWLHEPTWRVPDDELVVDAAKGSDLWRHTSYGFVRDSAHALLQPIAAGQAFEVDVHASMSEQFDQAGVLLRVDEERWLKAGLELADGRLGLGVVMTDGRSDWSTAPVDDWAGTWVRIRVSVADDSVTVRARPDRGAWQLVRLVPFDGSRAATAGPYCAAPSRSGWTARFRRPALTGADTGLH